MNQPTPIQSDLARAEETLRLLATIPAPEGIEARMHAALKAAPVSSNVLAWPSAGGQVRGQMRSLLRGAAAAAIVGVIAGGSWGVYSRVQPAEAKQPLVEMPRVTGSGSFSNAGAMRTPQTLNEPAAPQVDAAQRTTPDQAKPQPAAKTPAHAAITQRKRVQSR